MADDGAVAVFEGVSHRFGEREVLRDLHLHVRRGDVYGLLGLNGAGKTTTLRLLLRLLRRQSGRIALFGTPVEQDWIGLAGRIGATIEAPAFYPHLDARTNLRLLHDLGSRTGGRDPQRTLDLVGLSAAAGVATRKFSQGMLQRLSIAQALLGAPELVVLDEPTSNLDPQGIVDVRELIQRLVREDGATVILSSHQLSEVEGLCNRVAVLHGGRCVAETEVEALFKGEDCWVELESDRPDEALALLSRIPWCSEPGLTPRKSLRVRLPRLRCAQLNTELVKAGFAIAAFAPERLRLEDFFRRAIEEGGDGHQR
jgi:ABC-type multidrug transport system ATPase subunit